MSGNNTVPGAAPAGAAPAAGYYSRPELWADAQKYTDETNATYERLKHLEGGLQTRSKEIEGMGNALQYLQYRLEIAAKTGDDALIENARQRYDQMYEKYKIARMDYARNYGEYSRAYSGYQTAWNAQNTYMTAQEKAEKQWRSTIRDPETVKADIAAIEEQIKAQKTADTVAQVMAKYGGDQQAKSGNDLTSGYLTRPQDIPVMPTYSASGVSVGAVSPELQALLEQQKLLQEEYEWAMYLPYADLMQAQDFAEKSQYKSTYRGGEQFNNLSGTYTDTGFDDITYDYINRNETAINRQGLSDLQSNAALLGLDSSELRQMSDDEIAIFNYLYNPQDPAAAYEYITYLTSDLNARQRAAQERQWAEYAKERPGAASAFSVMMSPMKGLSYLGQAADYFADGKMDQNAGYNKFSYAPRAIREQVAEDIKASAKTEFWGGVGSFGYQTAMSMADFLTTTLVSGGNSTLAMAIMGSGAAADTVIDAKDRGLNDNQAFALGTIAGVAEAVTEKFSLDALLDKTSLGKSAAGYIFKNVLAEGSEEVASSLINTMADVLISQDKSQWQLAIDAYMADGKTEGQAFGLALADQAIALGLDALGGALSGGVMAGGNVVINKGATAIANRGRKGTQPVPQEAADMPTVAQPASFQEENQRQVAENMGARKTAQGATAQLAAPTVQVTDAQWQQGQRLAQLTGRNIKFYEGKASENGFFDPKTEEIWVNAKGGDPLAQVFSHELTHSIEQAGVYDKLSKLVLNRMQDTGMDLDNAREAKRQQYQRQGRPLPTQAAVDQELVAEYVSKHLLTNEAAIRSLVQQDRSLGQKIHDFFDRLLAKLGNKNAQERAFLSRAKNIYAKALRQTQAADMGTAQTVEQTATAAATEGADTEEISLDDLDAQLAAGEITEEEYDEIRDEHELLQEEQYSAGERKYSVGSATNQYDYSKPFAEQLADYKNGKIPKGDTLIVGGTPEVFQKIGMASLPVTINSTHIDYALNGTKDFDHHIGQSLLEQLPESIKKPVAVMTSGTKANSSVVAMLEIRHNGKQIVVPVAVNGFGRQNGILIDSNAITSVYGKNRSISRVLYDAIVEEGAGQFRLFYLDKNKATALLQKARVPMPKNSAIHNGGFIHSLSDAGSPVKSRFSDITLSQQFKRWFGDWQNHPENASKIVNADGTPKVMYHGTKVENGDFYVFDESKAVKKGGLGLKALGKGNYFTSKKLDGTERYGSRVISAYLNIRNPFIYNGGSSFQEQVAKELNIDTKLSADALQQEMRRRGYDGVVQYDERGEVALAVAFDSNQIKSTTDNIGTFDGGNPDIRYSLADEAENASEEKPEVDAPEAKPDLRSSMPRKAAEMLKRTERELLWAIADRLSVPKLAGREYLTPIIQEMADEYLEKGSISPETRQLLFEKAYAQAVIVDAEFYEQYKHIKDHLRTTPVTISDRDKLDIADFNDFRKRAFGSLKIVNEGGLPVDAAYQELQSMAPELFPESITHPADQLVRMFDASRSIQVTEKTVQDYFGKYEPEYRKGAQSAFEEAIAEAAGKLWEVKRFAEEKIAKEKESAPATEQEAMEAYQKLKKARRELDKVNAKNLLTESDQMQVGRLLRHEILPEDLKAGKDNVKGILAVFQAKQEYEHLCKLVAEYKRHLRGKARAEADELLKTANSWKDKRVGIAYSRETMERNVMDIIEDKALAQRVIDKYFAPVHTAEAASTRFKQDYRDRVRSMNISRKVQKGNLVSEAYAVQLLGEAQDNLQMLENARGRIKQRDGKNRHEWQAVIDALWAENPLLDRGKIEKAVKDFRYIYDALFQKMNQVRVANGYEPVNYRQGYFPHFQAAESDSVLAQFGRALGIDTRIDALPTTINGMTHAFKPGIQWFGNAQERLGFETAYDAVEGFDKYIEGVANVIHHTRNIQNLRAFASQIRYRTSDEGIRKQVDEVYQRQGLTDEEKQQLITEIYTHGKFTLSGFVAELDEYTNLLAGKKSRYDRAIEAAMGRKAYSVLKAWESRVAANMIAGNLTSALTNFIPWTQAGAQVGYMRLLRGVANTLQSTRSDDGFAGASTFLTNRRGVDPLVQTWAQKASGIASKPMELIDSLVSESIVRAAYEQNRQQGLSEAEAMAQADAFAAGVMADRSKGSTPTLFHSTNPLMKAFTQFQLEVNNQFSEVFKDIPRRYRDKKLRELVWVLLKYFLGAWLYNWLYEKLIGRRPALDPIGMLCQFGEDWKEDGLGTAGANLASDALGQLPFASGLTLIGVETDGGRLPASSAVMDLTAIWKAATAEGWSAKKRWKEVQDELSKLWYVAPPFAGNQISKIWKGLKAYFQGGSYTIEDVPIKDEEGNIIGVKGMPSLQYPVYKDNPGDAFASFVKATILGKSSLGTAQEWVDKGFNSLGAKQTAAYQDMLEAGVSDREAYELIRQISDAKETDTMKKSAVQRDVLRQSQVSGDGKAIAYYGLMASEKEWAIMDRLADMGADAGAVANALMDMADVRAKDGSKQADVLAVISKVVLTDEEKAVLVGSVIGTEMLTEEGNLTQYAKFDYAVQNGMGVDQYIQYRASGASIDDYLELRDAGATVEDAMEAAMALQELKDSVEDPATVQKWKAVMAGVTDPERQMISLSVVMSDGQYAKLTTARGFGVSPADFVSANEKIAKYDRDGNGRLTQAEVTQGISNLRLTMQQKAVLWQLITGSSSAKNNPYSQAIGERVIAALEWAKAEGKKPGHSFQDEIMRQIMANMNP